MNKILTVVVPAYNAELYLENNLASFCDSEWLSDIEVLIINDGSTDKTLEIAEHYVKKYPETYRVISKENGGHGSGINCGINNARGKYFKVVDADDWVEADAFRNLVVYLKTVNDDLVYSGFFWVYDQGENSVKMFKKRAEIKIPFPKVVYRKSYMFDEVAGQIYIKMHNMSVKTRILKAMNIYIDENCFYVDSEYITYPIPYIKTVSFLRDFVYMYRIGAPGQSVSMDKMKRNEHHYSKVIDSLFDYYSRLETEIECSAIKKTYIACIIARVIAGKYKIMLCMPSNYQQKTEMREFDRNIWKNYPEIYKSNKNKAVTILRVSGYRLYWIASTIAKRKYK